MSRFYMFLPELRLVTHHLAEPTKPR